MCKAYFVNLVNKYQLFMSVSNFLVKTNRIIAIHVLNNKQ